MSLDWETFVAKAPVIKAIRLTEDNVEELAKIIGADGYTMEKNLETNRRKVTFTKMQTKDEARGYQPEPRRIVNVFIGEYLVTYPETINKHAGERDAYFYSLSQDDIDKFVNQQRDKGEIEMDFPKDHYDY